MRIGIDARFYGPLGKGLGRYTEKLILHLETLDEENQYFVFLRKENFSEYQPRNPRFTKILADYRWYGIREQIFFPWRLWRFRCDLVHFPHFNVPIFYRRPFIVTIHDLILLHYPTLRNTTKFAWLYWVKFAAYRLTIASAIRRAKHIITVSHFTERDLLKNYADSRGKISVTYEAADPFCFWMAKRRAALLFRRLHLLSEAKEPRPEDRTHDIITPYFLYVGNAYPHKNLEFLITAARFYPKHRFVIVGKEDYFYDRLRAKAQREKADNVLFTGFVTDAELGTLYRHAALYLFPSFYEGFGLPPLEAMTYGVPVLSSDRASLPEILGEACVFFDPNRESSLRTSLDALLRDGKKREKLREAGYRRVASFRWDRMAEQTLAIYLSTKNKEKE